MDAVDERLIAWMDDLRQREIRPRVIIIDSPRFTCSPRRRGPRPTKLPKLPADIRLSRLENKFHPGNLWLTMFHCPFLLCHIGHKKS